MNLVPLTDRAEARGAFELFQERFSRSAQMFRDHSVGHRGATNRYDIYWHPEHGIWGLFDDWEDRGRFWICFGTQDPAVAPSLMITVEINPPFAGINRHCAGAFLHDRQKEVFIAHSGKVGGGRKGIGQSAFHEFMRDYVWEDVQWPDGGWGAFKVISAIDDPDLPSKIAAFVHDVERFKEWAVSSTESASAPQRVSMQHTTRDARPKFISPKYLRLHDYLMDLEKDEWRATFEDVEEILGRVLPKSARSYPAWWSNGSRMSQTYAWLNAGWQTSDLNLTGETVRFRRVESKAN